MAELVPDLRCWARRDDAPSWTGGEERGVLRDWLWQCGHVPADDLGLCAHHRAAIIGPPVAIGSPVKAQPVTRASILAWLAAASSGGDTT